MQTRATTVEHVGEWKVALAAETQEDLFAELARVIARAAGAPRAQPGDWETVTVTARDRVTLLADWANELLGRSEAAGRAFSAIRDVRIRDLPDGACEVSAQVRGRPVPRWTSPLKAATYHGLSIDRGPKGWRAVILFDV